MFGWLVEYYFISAKDQSRIHQFGKKVLPGLFLGYALYAGRIWKGDILVADIEELETMGASEIYSQRLNAKEVIFPKENGEFLFPIADGRSKLSWGDQELRTPTWIRERPIRGGSQRDFIGESEGFPPSTTSTLFLRCRWSDKWFVVHVRKHHLPPSRWTQRQTVLAERRIIPYSTEIHWRLQNYKNEFGCFARIPYRWLLEYPWIKRFVRLLDRFHTVYSIGRETSRRIYVVQEEIDKKAANIQARSFMAKALDKVGKKWLAEGEAYMVKWKTETRWCQKITRNLFHWPWGHGVQRNH